MRVTLSGNFASLDAHPLSWRWTDRRWNDLPPADVRLLRPLTDPDAREVIAAARTLVGREGGRRKWPPLAEPFFGTCAEFDTSGEPDDARDWLRARVPPDVTEVLVCWIDPSETPVPPILTPWDVFCRYWDDFCYPASDNVLVWSVRDDWAVFFHDSERLFAAHRRAPAPKG